jgi:hypothetical protein
LIVGKHLVGLFGLLEFFLGNLGRIPLVAVGVVLHRKFAIRLLDVFITGVFGNAQCVVVVFFGGHGSQSGQSGIIGVKGGSAGICDSGSARECAKAESRDCSRFPPLLAAFAVCFCMQLSRQCRGAL